MKHFAALHMSAICIWGLGGLMPPIQQHEGEKSDDDAQDGDT